MSDDPTEYMHRPMVLDELDYPLTSSKRDDKLRAEGVAAERARIVAWLTSDDAEQIHAAVMRRTNSRRAVLAALAEAVPEATDEQQ